jgi:hypothetical protein
VTLPRSERLRPSGSRSLISPPKSAMGVGSYEGAIGAARLAQSARGDQARGYCA